MELLEEIIKQYRVLANSSAMMLMEVEKKIYELEKLKMNENESKQIASHEAVMIPLAAYEMQLERFDVEKDKMRKHYQRIILAVSGALTAMIIGIFAFAFYFLSNYTLATVSQDGDGLNNYINQSSEVQVDYGAEDYRDKLPGLDQEAEGSLDK